MIHIKSPFFTLQKDSFIYYDMAVNESGPVMLFKDLLYLIWQMFH
jgi:hypothetical protein